jgi:hypothetical protein
LKDCDELYDLKADPYEMKNLIQDSSQLQQLEQMQARLAELLMQTR